MPTPTLLGKIVVPGYEGWPFMDRDAGLEVTAGGIDPTRNYSVPDSGSVTTTEIYTCAGINSLGMQITIPAARSINLDLVPVHPITLAEFSDAINGQFAIAVRLGLNNVTKYIVFGTNTDEGQVFLTTQAFKFRWSDNLGGAGATAISYTLFGFSTLSRGFSFE